MKTIKPKVTSSSVSFLTQRYIIYKFHTTGDGSSVFRLTIISTLKFPATPEYVLRSTTGYIPYTIYKETYRSILCRMS